MKQDRLAKHLAIGFVFAALLYLGGFQLIEHYRQVKGPWHVAFRADGNGQPSITITQHQLGLSNVTFVFKGEQVGQSNTEAAVIFDQPRTNVPFGKVLFLDTTFLPGTVTFDLFGHEIELAPRTLVVNLREVAWRSDATITLSERDKPRSK